MKTLKNVMFYAAPAFLFAPLAMAMELPTEANGMIQGAIDMLVTGQYGPLVMDIIDMIGKASVVLTALAFAVETFCKTTGIALNKAGLTHAAEKIHAFQDKVSPWIKYASLYNLQKGRNVQGA